MFKNDTLIKIHGNDNVAVALRNISKGETLALGDFTVVASEDVEKGHKIAFQDIAEGENIIKYGFAIGHATKNIKAGDYIHTHNIKTNLKGMLDYTYEPKLSAHTAAKKAEFMGYKRKNGEIGIRNEIWIVTTVGCINKTAELLAKKANERFANKTDGIFAYTHPYGCSQLGEDHETTQKVLADMVKHPNAAGVLVLGLGCENNNIPVFKKVIGDYDENRVKFLSTQEVDDEVEAGLELIGQLVDYAGTFEREKIPASEAYCRAKMRRL